MLDIQTRIRRLQRPNLLIQAARFGLEDYNRGPFLRRVLNTEKVLKPVEALIQLLELEAIINDERTTKQATYSIARHVDILIAIIAEAETMRATSRPT